jgi:hypothetical protein
MVLALAGTANAGIAPVPDTLRTRSDGWERDMLFSVSGEPDVDVSYVRFAVVGCAARQGYVVAVEIDDEPVEDFPALEWVTGGDERASIVADIICGVRLVRQF